MEWQPFYSDNLYADIKPSYTDSLMHHGIKGMHWGIRRYQNADGSLTSQGKKRYSLNPIKRHFQKKEDARKAAEQAKIDAMSPSERKHYFAQKKIDDQRISYMGDFDKTPTGKKLRKQYQDSQQPDWDRYDSDEKYYTNFNNNLERTQRNYYHTMGDYMVKRMVKEHGYSEVKAYADSQRYPEGRTLEERFGKDLEYTHGM